MAGMESPLTLPDNQPTGIAGANIDADEVVNIPEDAIAKDSSTDAITGITVTENDDGSVDIDFSPKRKKSIDDDFNSNLAEDMSASDLATICSDLRQGIDADIQSRSNLDKTYERGIELLGLTLEEANSDIAEGSISKVYHPLLLEAVVRYQANFVAEMLPAAGPVKVMDYSTTQDPGRIKLAEDFEKDFNRYLVTVRKEYYPDTRKMAFAQGFCGNGFKKIYHCPLRRSPVSDYVPMTDLIVSNDAVSLANCGRITHRTRMRYPVLKRLQIVGKYRDIELSPPNEQPTGVETKIARVEGLTPSSRREDQRYTICESYVDLDLPGYENEDGLPLPYRITMDYDSREILEIRRNWKEDDEDFKPVIRFVKYGYIPGLGFYDYGLIHLLGNTSRALTALDRQLLDAGQFANFPGFLLSDVGGRQETSRITIKPGGGQTIKTGGQKLGDVVLPLPYKDPSQVLAALAKNMADDGRRLGMTAEVNVGEGRADVPVGTTVALIEQATKVMAAVHKQNHSAQQEEFEMLRELIAEDPTALWRFAKRPQRKWETAEEFSDIDLVPASDPNVPSHVHRIMQSTALVQLVLQFPELNRKAALDIILTTLGYPTQTLIQDAPPPPPAAGAPAKPATDPLIGQAKMAEVQVKDKEEQREAATALMETQAREQEQQADIADKQADRESREHIEEMKLEQAKQLANKNVDNSKDD